MTENLEKASPVVLLELGGAQRRLTLDLHAAVQFQKLTGKSLLAGQIDMRDAKHWNTLLWAALLDSMPELDGDIDDSGKADDKVRAGLRTVAKWCPLNRMRDVNDAVARVIEQSQPPAEAGAKKD